MPLPGIGNEDEINKFMDGSIPFHIDNPRTTVRSKPRPTNRTAKYQRRARALVFDKTEADRQVMDRKLGLRHSCGLPSTIPA